VTGYERTADFGTGLLTTAWRDGAGEWRRTCFVSRARDVIVQRLEVPPGARADLEVRHDVRLPGAPPGLAVFWRGRVGGRGTVVGLRARYPDPADRRAAASDSLKGHPNGPGEQADGPGGHDGYCGATRIEAADGECVLDGPVAWIRGAGSVLLLTRVGRFGAGADPEARLAALTQELSAVPADHRLLLAEHVRLHRRAYGRTRLTLSAPAADRRLPVAGLLRRQAADPGRPLPALLEKLFDSGRYLLLSASGLLPPRLTGLWQGDWHAAWSGAIVTNANLNLQLAGAVTANVPAAVHALADLVSAQLADWQRNASRLYGARGILAPAHTDGASGLARHFATAYPHQMWTAGADWLLAPLLDHVHATGDHHFLRERVLPALTELARFYEDFLADQADGPERGGDLVLVPSYSPENHPAGWSEAAVNATMDIAAARHALTAACDWRDQADGRRDQADGRRSTADGRRSTADGRRGTARNGADRSVQRWQALLARLPGYRVNSDGALAEWAWPPSGPPLPDSYDHRHVSHLYPVWPLHEITVDDTPALASAALAALRLRTAENGAAHGYLHQALAAARLRDAGLAGRRLAALTGGGFFFRSLMSSHYPDLSVYNADAACALPGLLLEMLVDSVPARAGRPGRVALLPAVPGFLAAGRLRGARTLTQVDIDLTWDLNAGVAEAVLRSQVRQQIELTCRAAVGRATVCRATVGRTPVDRTSVGNTPAGHTTAGRTAVGQAADAYPAQLRPGCWRLDLPAGVPVRVTLEEIE
jgi:hypothetical protein